jgi:phosphoribosylaminoimidazole carboxylase (NCAIR synthetase)
MVLPKTKVMTVEIEKWLDDALEARYKKSGVSKKFQVNEALKEYLENKTVAKSV